MGARRTDLGPDEAVARVARADPRVLAAYVFGSRARGEHREASDLDVALILGREDHLSYEHHERLRSELARAAGLRVDLAVVSEQTPVLAFEVIEGGRRVFSRDDESADAEEERLLQRHLDTQYLRRVQNHYLLGTPL
jgi:hypothetical protein